MEFHAAIVPDAQTASTPAWCFAFVDGRLLLPEHISEQTPGAGLAPLRLQGLQDLEIAQQSRHYLGRLDGLDCWALRLAEVPVGWQSQSLRAAMMSLPGPLMALAGRAAQVLEWDRTHAFCGACGTPTEVLAHERARRCPACGHTAYPRLSPAMMCLIWRSAPRGPELLLARAPGFAPGMYSALAGFVEPGESLEDCVHREVLEEVGVRVRDLRYYGSQSWPFPHSLMLAFTAEWTGGEIVPQAGEIEDAQWFPLDALPGIPPRFSIAGHLIRDLVARLAQAA